MYKPIAAIWLAGLMGLLCCGGVAQATPILNNHTTSSAPEIKLENWEFIWSSDPFMPGIGMIVDLDGVIDPFQVRFKGMNADPNEPVSQWISAYAGAKYSFIAIDFYTFTNGTYYTSIGKGVPADLWTNTPLHDRITFPGVGLELYQVTSVPAPGAVFLLVLGIISIILTRARREPIGCRVGTPRLG